MSELVKIALSFSGTELIAEPVFSTRWPRLFGPVAVRGAQRRIPCGGLHDVTPFEVETLLYGCVVQVGEAWHHQQLIAADQEAEGLFDS